MILKKEDLKATGDCIPGDQCCMKQECEPKTEEREGNHKKVVGAFPCLCRALQPSTRCCQTGKEWFPFDRKRGEIPVTIIVIVAIVNWADGTALLIA